MTVSAFLFPVFVLIALTFVLHAMMGRERIGSLKRGDVKVQDIALREPNWTKRALQVGNAYHNQLELPILFYVLIAFILITKAESTILLVLAWVFVLSRLVHAYIHTTSNIVDHRFKAYGVGLIVLAVMWIIFALEIVVGA